MITTMDANESLFTRAARGDLAALEGMLAQYLPTLHAYVRIRLAGALEPRESSLDVVQSVCRQILAGEPRTSFADENHFRAWLFNAAVNKLREKFRRHRSQRRALGRESLSLDHDPITVAAFVPTPSQQAIGNETAAAVTAALAALSEPHREVVTLARLVKVPHKVIAEIMGKSEPAVRQLLGRAMLALADELRRRGVDTRPWRDD